MKYEIKILPNNVTIFNGIILNLLFKNISANVIRNTMNENDFSCFCMNLECGYL